MKKHDWTAINGKSNSSPKYLKAVELVEALIRQSAYDLISGRADVTAQLVVAQLAHQKEFDFGPPAHHVSPERRVAAVTFAMANIVGCPLLRERAYRDEELVHDGQMPEGGHCDKLLEAWALLGKIDPDGADEVDRILELASFENLNAVVALGRENYEARVCSNCGGPRNGKHHQEVCETKVG